jgi:ankyrin repeat protein
MGMLGALLFSAGSDDKPTAFVACARVGALRAIDRMIDENPEAVHWTSYDGETAFMAAADWAKFDFTDRLLERGSDINARDKQGDTALLRSVRKLTEKRKTEQDDAWYRARYMKVIEYLVLHDASITMQDRNGRNPVALALAQGMPDVAELISDTAEKRQRDIWHGCAEGVQKNVAIRKAPLSFRK